MYNNSLMVQQKICSGLDPREQHAHVVSLSKITEINYAQALCGDLSLANARHQLYGGRDPSSPTDGYFALPAILKTLSAGDIVTARYPSGNAHLIHDQFSALRQDWRWIVISNQGLAAATRCHSDPKNWDAVYIENLLTRCKETVSPIKRGRHLMPSLRQSIEATTKGSGPSDRENMDPRLAVAEAWLQVVEIAAFSSNAHSHRSHLEHWRS